ncbi:6-bladed beta-propeller [Bacteroides fluxus]|uniref:6-bladed beta-propeller n=1 Tax=Bacteroides fluxus TaxID=626930 RepID=UPI00267285FF|nr:6-bladed beta-propeller [Bacteroides fluxus]
MKWKVMIMYRTIIYVFVVFLMITSCTENTKKTGKYPDLVNEAVDTIYYSQFVDSIKYISLETTDTCLIGEIADVQMSGEHIFVLDIRMQTVGIFSKDGKYQGKIFHKGDASGEYINMCQFEYDENNNRIIILDLWTHTLLFYTIAGEYLKSIKLDIGAFDFKVLPSGGYVVSLAGADSKEAGIYHLDDSGKIVKRLVNRNQEHLIYLNSNWDLCSIGDDVCFMAPNFDNEVYHFNGKELDMVQSFCMKPEMKHSYKENISLEHMEDFVRTRYIESKKWLFASYWCAVFDVRYFLYSKMTDEYLIGKYLKNDLDGIQCSGKTSMTEENTFLFWYALEEDRNPTLQTLYLKK